MDILLTILAIILCIIGLAGSVIPVLPGPPVSWVGLLLFSFTDYYEQSGWFLWVWLAVVVLVTLADNFLPVVMTKKFGGSRAATIGTIIGMLVGMFLGPLGMILGPFAGAFVGELIGNRRQAESHRVYSNGRGANRGTKQEQRSLADYALQGRGKPVKEENERGEVNRNRTEPARDTGDEKWVERYGQNETGRSETGPALRVATGAFVAFISGVGIKLISSGMILYYVVKDLIV